MQDIKNYFRHHFSRPPVIGATFALLLVLSPLIMGGSASLIVFSVGGLVIVVGGVITVAYMSFDPTDVRTAIDTILDMFKKPIQEPKEPLANDVAAIIYCAKLLRQNGGMRNFETVIGRTGIRDPFLKYGLNMVLGEYEPAEIRAMLETAANTTYQKEYAPVEVLQAMTSHAPAFGMVGTLIGMVAMLCNLDGNIAALGPSLAVAFLSTLYGVLSARILYIPAASILQKKVDRRRYRNHLITEGMVMLVGKKAPMQVQDRLNGFLKPESRNYFDSIAPISPLVHRKMASAA